MSNYNLQGTKYTHSHIPKKKKAEHHKEAKWSTWSQMNSKGNTWLIEIGAFLSNHIHQTTTNWEVNNTKSI